MNGPTFGIITRVFGTREHPMHHFLWEMTFSPLCSRWQGWHHVLVNDGSTDDSARVIREYVGRGDVKEKATVITQANRGPAAAFNAAVRALPAHVEWLVCLDADDKFDARYLWEAADVIMTRPEVNIIYAPCRHFGSVHSVYPFPPYVGTHAAWMQQCQIPGQAVYRRSLWEALGGYDETMTSAEDWDFFIRANLKVGLVPHKLPMPRWYYRVHDGPRASTFAMSRAGQQELRAYWRGHTKENLGTRTWGAWRKQQEAAA